MNRDTLLIVDDMETNRAILNNLFAQEYNLLEAENGAQALMMIRQYQDVLAAVLLDVVMPVKDGYEVMAEMSKTGLMASIPVIVITSEDSMENEVRAFDLGAADIIIKPFEPHVVRRRVQNAVELNLHKMHLEELVEEQSVKLRRSRDVILDTLSSIIEHRSVETGQHVLRIRMFTKVLLENVMRCCPEYELSERSIGVIAEAAALHDIGKISIPDTILNKPGRLTAEEFEVMKTHTVKGCEILSGLDRMGDEDYLQYAYNICRYHHERWDGSGYPDGLSGDNTPICAQAVGIADAFDALTTDRVYKKAIPADRALTMILNGECGAFSPRLLECLKNVRPDFFDLARNYADGRTPKSDHIMPPDRPAAPIARTADLPDLGQLKYFAILRYLEATVMEVDMNSGIYHLVYQRNEDFQDLRSGGSFEESFRIFAERSVHPDDRHILNDVLDTYIDDFFSRGLIRRSRSYRVLHRASGEYLWYRATAMRVEIDNPKRHKALLIWEPVDQAEGGRTQREGKLGIPVAQNLLVGVQQCLNDPWFTIIYANEGFVTLFGYSRQELKARFQDRFLNLVHPDDRAPMYKQFLEQLNTGSAKDLEYRVIAKDGRTIWVLDKCQPVMGEDGREYLNCVLIDITQVKQAQEDLRLSMERYQIILDQTNDIIFEWNIALDHITYSPNWVKLFGYTPLANSARVQTASHLFPSDLPVFQSLMASVAGGEPYAEAEVRIANQDGKYLWCRIRATTQFDDGGKPIKAVGVIVDIDAEKRRTQELAARAERDALTKLYNKNTAREKIQNMLETRSKADRFAMLTIDLDNFKQVNDLYGHMFGDAVLAEVSARLKALFREEDVVARFGGDEFLVFLRYQSDSGFLLEKAAAIVESCGGVLSDTLRDCQMSCSVGISRCPEDGTDFHTLFQRCDQALYQAKYRGKKQYLLYDGSTMSRTFEWDTEQASAVGTRIESDDASAIVVDSIVSQAFQRLYESKDVETAVNSILEMVGRRYNVSRVYIFENSEDNTWCRNTFEWCGMGVLPELENLQHVSYERLGGHYQENFNENGVFYCRDISQLPKGLYDILFPQGIRSLLQCEVRDGGRFAGFVGFDDCLMQRMWTQGQIDALHFIAELLSTFLLKKRAQDRAVAAAEDLRIILDHQNSWIYVIDPDTFVLRYLNAKTLRTVPGVQLGMTCHQAFFHRDRPCAHCPAKQIRRTVNQTLEVYNPLLNVWSIADASLIRWEDEDACLLACHDITDYKPAPPAGMSQPG